MIVAEFVWVGGWGEWHCMHVCVEGRGPLAAAGSSRQAAVLSVLSCSGASCASGPLKGPSWAACGQLHGSAIVQRGHGSRWAQATGPASIGPPSGPAVLSLQRGMQPATPPCTSLLPHRHTRALHTLAFPPTRTQTSLTSMCHPSPLLPTACSSPQPSDPRARYAWVSGCQP